MSLTQKYLETIEKKLRELGNDIDRLNAKAKTDAKIKYEEKKAALQEQADELLKKADISIENELKEWNAKIEKLTDKAKIEAKKEYDEVLKNIMPGIEELKGEISRLKTSGSGAWEDIKEGTTTAWKDIKNSLTNAFSKFK